jgi:light-harvesting protein B-800-850 alpha chain
MNQGRIWCVVNPTVGLPLFLGSVAVTSLIVHASVLGNTTWFASYWGGKAKVKAAAVESVVAPVALDSANTAPGFVISVAPVAGKAANAETAFLITVAPKPAQQAQSVADASPAQKSESVTVAASTLK